MTTIAYDQPIVDFIAGLDATGHVNHVAYRKTSVTFHHNGGRLSLQGCLDVWKVREASAHFDSDGEGRLGQYVRVNEYAWAAGNTQGNKESIHIEMCNATLAPDWLIANATWKSAARLGGWLFACVIGEAPTRETVHVHHDWKATTCAGPFIDNIREQLFQEVLAAYRYFVGGGPAPAPPPPPSPADHPPRLAWSLRPGQYIGDRRGAARSIGAAYNPRTRRWDAPHPLVRNVQQWLIYHGCVPGQTNWRSGWADGLFDAPYSTAAARRWHERFYPGQPYPEQIWSDDYDRLARP